MANGIRTGDPNGFKRGRSSKFREGFRVLQTSEEGRGTYRPKRWGNNNKDEDNSPKPLMIKIIKLRLRNLDNSCTLFHLCSRGGQWHLLPAPDYAAKDLAWAGVFSRSARSSTECVSVIVSEGHHLLLVF